MGLIIYSFVFAERDALLEQLKVYGRDPTNADPIFTKRVGHTSGLEELLTLNRESRLFADTPS